MSTRRSFLMQAAAGVTAAGLQLPEVMAGIPSLEPTRPMKTYKLPHTDLVVSRIAYGPSDLGGNLDPRTGGNLAQEPVTAEQVARGVKLLHTAYDNGITLFDLADMYAFGKSETVFGEVLKQSPGLRDKIVLQTKCGIRLPWPLDNPPPPGRHLIDLSYDHIVEAAEGSLRRLATDRLDILLFHQPDALVEPEEVARAFEHLHRSGKVRYFGVSNHTAAQIDLLKRYVRQPLIVNQVQLSLSHPDLITDGMDFNRWGERRLTHRYMGVSGLLDYCRLHDIRVQAYSPISGVTNVSADMPANLKATIELLQDMAARKNTTHIPLALAWLLRHPAGIIPISGAGKPEHIVENCTADGLSLTRAEWYSLLYTAAAESASPPVR